MKYLEYIDTSRGLKQTLIQLRDLEDKSLDKSISGTIFTIDGNPYMLAKIYFHNDTPHDRMDNLYWSLIGLDGNRYYDPMTFNDLAHRLLELTYRGSKVELLGHINDFYYEFKKLLGIEGDN